MYLTQAIKQLLRWGPENIQHYANALTKDAIAEFQEIGYKIEDEAYRGSHLFGIRLPESIEMAKLETAFRTNRVSVSMRGDSIRISTAKSDFRILTSFSNGKAISSERSALMAAA